jgi:dTDP-4-dehydrorhamnose 3,5-epimerase
MQFQQTPIAGAWLVTPEPRADERGSFARVWCRDEFATHGLRADFVQCNSSVSRQRGTLRGLHYQAPPHEEIKLVSCLRGRVFDVAVDLRPDSPTFRAWFGVELAHDAGTMMYVPRGCAHGYLTLEDDSEVMYPVTALYVPSAERGLRWDDPAIGVTWPIPPVVMSDKDRQWPDFATPESTQGRRSPGSSDPGRR